MGCVSEVYLHTPRVLNYIWLGLILAAIAIGGVTGKMDEVTQGAFEMAETAVNIALGFIGFFALWLGVMRLAERSGMIRIIAVALKPLMRRLFPEVPPDHPAMGSIIMNMSANMLGLANAATPLGLRAMKHLERLNPRPGTATNAMCTFLAINTSSIQLIPASAVAVLAAEGAKDPTAIIGTAFVATLFSTIVAITAVKIFEKFPHFRLPPVSDEDAAKKHEEEEEDDEPQIDEAKDLRRIGAGQKLILVIFFVLFGYVLLRTAYPTWVWLPADPELAGKGFGTRLIEAISLLAIPFLLSFFPLYAAIRGLKVYDEFVEGAKEGFWVAVRIIPYLVTILVAIGMFRGAGGIELLTSWLAPALNFLTFPPDLLPMALMRPLSGSGSMGVFVELVDRLGPDDIVTLMAGTFFGSSETTFYVIAVYFGSVGIRRTRHAVPAGLIADLAGLVAAVVVCRMVFG